MLYTFVFQFLKVFMLWGQKEVSVWDLYLFFIYLLRNLSP
jgi:hypothetical protein